MRSLTCVSVVVCVACKLRPCPSYSRCKDRINLVLWRSLYKGRRGGVPDLGNLFVGLPLGGGVQGARA